MACPLPAQTNLTYFKYTKEKLKPLKLRCSCACPSPRAWLQKDKKDTWNNFLSMFFLVLFYFVLLFACQKFWTKRRNWNTIRFEFDFDGQRCFLDWVPSAFEYWIRLWFTFVDWLRDGALYHLEKTLYKFNYLYIINYCWYHYLFNFVITCIIIIIIISSLSLLLIILILFNILTNGILLFYVDSL